MKQPEIVELLVRKDDRIANLEAENQKLKDAIANATEVIENLIGGKRIINLDEAIAFYKSLSTPKGRNLDSRNS